MGIQTMGSQANGGGCGGGTGKQARVEFPSNPSSFCNLTLNEVQNHLGEPLRSMNFVDLLRNAFPRQSTSAGHESHDKTRFLSNKTVEEVWREIQQKKGSNDPQKQSKLGEMTLEDFLMKAGVVTDGSYNKSDDGSLSFTRGSQSSWLLRYQEQQQSQQSMKSNVPSNPVSLPSGIDASNAILDAVYPDGSGRKRVTPDEIAEKTAERRKKRMIKNRESAARSRARKQAYTNELENKIMRLEEENEMLRKQKELVTFLHCASLLEPKQQLRRSISAPF